MTKRRRGDRRLVLVREAPRLSGRSSAAGAAERLSDVAQLAAERLPPEVWDFIEGGSGDGDTVTANRAALDRVKIRSRVLTDVSEPTGYCRILDADSSLPIAVAPMAYQRLLHSGGEVEMARAALDSGVPLVLSTLSSCAIEDVVAVGAVVWFQLFWLRDRAALVNLVRRAENAGCTALMVTVDMPVTGRMLRDIRNQFALPPDVKPVNLPVSLRGGLSTRRPGASAPAVHAGAVVDPGVDWADLDWLRELTDLPLIVKGVLDPEDADRAAASGADAIVVSNHGGRQLEGAVPSIMALPSVAAAVGGRCEVFLDSGIRTGTDIVRALALGASAVLIGRPTLWGLAVDGAPGVARVLDILRLELELALALAGCSNVLAAGRLSTMDLLAPVQPPPVVRMRPPHRDPVES